MIVVLIPNCVFVELHSFQVYMVKLVSAKIIMKTFM